MWLKRKHEKAVQKGQILCRYTPCTNPECLYKHTDDVHRRHPVGCIFYRRGRCTRENCTFAHVDGASSADAAGVGADGARADAAQHYVQMAHRSHQRKLDHCPIRWQYNPVQRTCAGYFCVYHKNTHLQTVRQMTVHA